MSTLYRAIKITPTNDDVISTIFLDNKASVTGGTVNVANFTQLTAFTFNNQTFDYIQGFDKTGNLQVLTLSGCNALSFQLSGLYVDKATNLYRLVLNDTNIQGTFKELSSSPAIKQLNTSRTSLTGNVVLPQSIESFEHKGGGTKKLKASLEPFEYSNLVSFDISNNLIYGTVPSLSSLKKLTKLNLSNNQLIGPVPLLDGISALQSFDISNNTFTSFPLYYLPKTIKNISIANNRLSLNDTFKALVAANNLKSQYGVGGTGYVLNLSGTNMPALTTGDAGYTNLQISTIVNLLTSVPNNWSIYMGGTIIDEGSESKARAQLVTLADPDVQSAVSNYELSTGDTLSFNDYLSLDNRVKYFKSVGLWQSAGMSMDLTAETLSYIKSLKRTISTVPYVNAIELSWFVMLTKSIGVWKDLVCWPLKSTNNTGSNTLIKSFGGLGSYDANMAFSTYNYQDSTKNIPLSSRNPIWSDKGIYFNYPRTRDLAFANGSSPFCNYMVARLPNSVTSFPLTLVTVAQNLLTGNDRNYLQNQNPLNRYFGIDGVIMSGPTTWPRNGGNYNDWQYSPTLYYYYGNVFQAVFDGYYYPVFTAGGYYGSTFIDDKPTFLAGFFEPGNVQFTCGDSRFFDTVSSVAKQTNTNSRYWNLKSTRWGYVPGGPDVIQTYDPFYNWLTDTKQQSPPAQSPTGLMFTIGGQGDGNRAFTGLISIAMVIARKKYDTLAIKNILKLTICSDLELTNINQKIPFDPDVYQYITEAGVTDYNNQADVYNFVAGLKRLGLWEHISHLNMSSAYNSRLNTAPAGSITARHPRFIPLGGYTGDSKLNLKDGLINPVDGGNTPSPASDGTNLHEYFVATVSGSFIDGIQFGKGRNWTPYLTIVQAAAAPFVQYKKDLAPYLKFPLGKYASRSITEGWYNNNTNGLLGMYNTQGFYSVPEPGIQYFSTSIQPGVNEYGQRYAPPRVITQVVMGSGWQSSTFPYLSVGPFTNPYAGDPAYTYSPNSGDTGMTWPGNEYFAPGVDPNSLITGLTSICACDIAKNFSRQVQDAALINYGNTYNDYYGYSANVQTVSSAGYVNFIMFDSINHSMSTTMDDRRYKNVLMNNAWTLTATQAQRDLYYETDTYGQPYGPWYDNVPAAKVYNSNEYLGDGTIQGSRIKTRWEADPFPYPDQHYTTELQGWWNNWGPNVPVENYRGKDGLLDLVNRDGPGVDYFIGSINYPAGNSYYGWYYSYTMFDICLSVEQRNQYMALFTNTMGKYLPGKINMGYGPLLDANGNSYTMIRTLNGDLSAQYGAVVPGGGGSTNVSYLLPVYDSDAYNYFVKAYITDYVNQNNIYNFITGLKSLGLWNNALIFPLRQGQNTSNNVVYSLGGFQPRPAVGSLSYGANITNDGLYTDGIQSYGTLDTTNFWQQNNTSDFTVTLTEKTIVPTTSGGGAVILNRGVTTLGSEGMVVQLNNDGNNISIAAGGNSRSLFSTTTPHTTAIPHFIAFGRASTNFGATTGTGFTYFDKVSASYWPGGSNNAVNPIEFNSWPSSGILSTEIGYRAYVNDASPSHLYWNGYASHVGFFNKSLSYVQLTAYNDLYNRTLGIGLFGYIPYLLPNYDADVYNYIQYAGITKLEYQYDIYNFVTGIKSLGLYDKMICWPLRSVHNTGSGPVVYCLGNYSNNTKLPTGNIGTLYSETTAYAVPEWSTLGISFSSSRSWISYGRNFQLYPSKGGFTTLAACSFYGISALNLNQGYYNSDAFAPCQTYSGEFAAYVGNTIGGGATWYAGAQRFADKRYYAYNWVSSSDNVSVGWNADTLTVELSGEPAPGGTQNITEYGTAADGNYYQLFTRGRSDTAALSANTNKSSRISYLIVLPSGIGLTDNQYTAIHNLAVTTLGRGLSGLKTV